jgi:hypothetical protein
MLYEQVEFKQLEHIYFEIGIGLNHNVHDVCDYDVHVCVLFL